MDVAFADPPLEPGRTDRITVHGRGFLPAASLVSNDARIVIESYEVLGPGTIGAVVTTAPGLPPRDDLMSLGIQNPAPADSVTWNLSVIDSACAAPIDDVPPAAVRALMLRKTAPGPGAPIDMTGEETTLDRRGETETMCDDEAFRSPHPASWHGLPWRVTASPRTTLDPSAGSVPLECHLVRARDAAGHRGDLR